MSSSLFLRQGHQERDNYLFTEIRFTLKYSGIVFRFGEFLLCTSNLEYYI